MTAADHEEWSQQMSSMTVPEAFVIVGYHFTFLWVLEPKKEQKCTTLILSQLWTRKLCSNQFKELFGVQGPRGPA